MPGPADSDHDADAVPHDPTSASGGAEHDESIVPVQLRRTPRYRVFMLLGAVVGAIAAWAIAMNMGPAFDQNGQRIDTSPVLGLSLVTGFVLGILVGGLLAVILDRTLGRRTASSVAERVVTIEEVPGEQAPAADDPDTEAPAGDATDVMTSAASPPDDLVLESDPPVSDPPAADAPEADPLTVEDRRDGP